MASRKKPANARAKDYDSAEKPERAPAGVAGMPAHYHHAAPAAIWNVPAGIVWPDEPTDFPAITRSLQTMSDEVQVGVIRHGLSANLARSLGQTFDISVGELSKVLLVSESTLTRKSRDNALLDPSTTERVLRIAAITALAIEVFEDEAKATAWMKRDNVALGGQAPLSLCDNDISAAQVRRVLRAIEYGGVV